MDGRRIEGLLPAWFAPLTRKTAAAAAVSAAASATTALSLGTSFIDIQRAAFESHAIQASDGLVSFIGIAHFNKREAAGAASVTIGHQIDTINGSIPLEHRTDGRIGSGKIQIAYENILHLLNSFCLSIVRARQGGSGRPSSGGTIKRHI
jgi:hypothetical protein